MTSSQYKFYDGSWNELFEGVSQRGDRQGLRKAGEQIDAKRSVIATDGKRWPIHRPIHAFMIDYGIDPRIPGMAARLNVKLYDSLPLFAPQRNNLFASFLDILSNTDHGTQIAAIIMSDIPGIRLHFLHIDQIHKFNSMPHLRRSPLDQIRQSQARVVNLSFYSTYEIASCENFFGSMFKELKDVLFVIAAGNDGYQNAQDACPASLGQYFDHVLTVAGVEEDGIMAEHSSRGIRQAKVAAPYSAHTVAVGSTTGPPKGSLQRADGTSVSAALVSNAALRLLARHPHIHATQAADIVIHACRHTHLDVACGGDIDFEKLEAYSHEDQHGIFAPSQ